MHHYNSRIMMAINALFLLGSIVCLSCVQARNTGAPTDACSTITPNHPGSSQTIPGGFFIYSDLVDNGGGYTASTGYTSIVSKMLLL